MTPTTKEPNHCSYMLGGDKGFTLNIQELPNNGAQILIAPAVEQACLTRVSMHIQRRLKNDAANGFTVGGSGTTLTISSDTASPSTYERLSSYLGELSKRICEHDQLKTLAMNGMETKASEECHKGKFQARIPRTLAMAC